MVLCGGREEDCGGEEDLRPTGGVRRRGAVVEVEERGDGKDMGCCGRVFLGEGLRRRREGENIGFEETGKMRVMGSNLVGSNLMDIQVKERIRALIPGSNLMGGEGLRIPSGSRASGGTRVSGRRSRNRS
ncbi:hypothetical protein E3N88_03508 [Mikania micrantha]|uniref:Uncharacterized protein n=1 Tax=Mikania micrantha TaxID=192012 RepID=A0A5N6Q6X5_9ASTR|nr:hypothetical protein E3N88_03508 [Mikania micrantha]